jgi:hypothetical protein
MNKTRNVAVLLASLMLAVQTPLAAQNVAQGKATAQSSNYTFHAGGESWKAVDGNTNGVWNFVDPALNSISHTLFERNAWWYVDLGSTPNIAHINIWNRTDLCCEGRLFPYRVVIQDVFNAALNSANDLWSADVLAGATPMIFNPAGVSGRYVKVQLLEDDWLHLAEVEVFVVPEPVGMILLGTGLAGIAAVRRRRQRWAGGSLT